MWKGTPAARSSQVCSPGSERAVSGTSSHRLHSRVRAILWERISQFRIGRSETVKGPRMIDFPRDRGRRRPQARGSRCHCGLILVVAAWFAFPWFLGSKTFGNTFHRLSCPHPGNRGNAVPARSEATSVVAKQNPAGKEAAKQNPADDEHASVGRASATKETSEPINID